MILLSESLAAWGSSSFKETLKRELEQLDAARLPLQAGLTGTSHVTASQHTVMVLGANDEDDVIRARVGVFYGGVLMGCSCADDPTPVEEQPEYCVLEVTINLETAEASIAIQSDES